MRIVIIEDDEEIIKILKITFRIRWPTARLFGATNGSDGIRIVEEEAPDLVILDLGLPDMDGFEVLEQIRAFSSEIPIIILTITDDKDSIVRALECGADEYITKPFHQLELLARASVLLKHKSINAGETNIYAGPFRLSKYSNVLMVNERRLILTNTEKIIMHHLILNANNPVSTSFLSEAIWGDGHTSSRDSIRTYIWRLRKKIEPDLKKPSFIVTIPQQGFKLTIG